MDNDPLILDVAGDFEMNPLFKEGDKVRMKQEVLDEFDRDGIWAFHESLKGKVLTIIGAFGNKLWVDYYVEESPFALAEKWLEVAG